MTDPAATPPEHTNRALLRWVWRDYLRRERWWFALAGVFMILQGMAMGATSWVVMPMFDRVFVGGNLGAIPWVAGLVAAIFLVRAVSNFMSRILLQGTGLRILGRMQTRLLDHIMTLDPAWFQRNAPGTLIDRVRGDTAQANQIWQQVFAKGFQDVVTLISLFAVALYVDWVWTLVAVAGAPLLLGPVVAAQRYVRKTSRAAREASARLSVRLDEIFHGIDTVKLAGAETREMGRFEDIMDRYLGREMKSRLGQASIPFATDIVAAIGFAGVIWVGGRDIIGGDKTVGEFMAFFTAMGLLFEPLRRVANLAGQWQVARASLERVRALFDARPSIRSPEVARALSGDARDMDIVFDAVRVDYGGAAALDGASFTARAGETTALVGASGAGKSTIFKALTRLVDPVSGEVRVGDVPTTALSLGDLRRLFGVVSQDAPMFDETLRENIVLNTEGADEARLARALDAAYLGDLVAGMADGLETLAGPRGSQLSGGQRQRVAIARAVLRDAPILLLDEATSALDAESEAHVQAALERLASERTTLVIAHRLSTIRNADRIVVMDRGRVAEVGQHDDLLAAGGVYARLYALQFSEDDRS